VNFHSRATMVPLGDVAEFINGVAFRPEDWSDQGRRIIRIQNLNDPAKPYNRTTRSVPEKYEVCKGTLLVSWSASLGVFEWAHDDVAIVNQHIFKVVPDRRKVHQAYLRHMLHNALIDMERHHRGSTMVHVNRGEFLGTTIPLPPLEEQKRIAAILDQADALRRLRRRALDRLNALGQAIFHEMFGDPEANEKGWKVRELHELVRDGDVINYGVVQPGEDVEGGVPLVRVGDLLAPSIKPEGLKKIDRRIEASYARSRLKGGEILIACVGSIGTVRRVSQFLAGANIARAVARVAVDARKIHPDFLTEHLRTDATQAYFTKEVRLVAQPTLNIKQIKETLICLPPQELQEEFATRIATVSQADALHAEAIERHEVLFEALQARAFSEGL
jgi:type I restriction enzyme, S subunit